MATMTKTATVRARIEPRLKNDVEALFKPLGLSTLTDSKVFGSFSYPVTLLSY